ncbi:hypothetical protein JG688_00011916 [Phytophthora aleatoria]|uniref:Protein kinase domain-containing protein n=1 Tax=Phytophthora aleatoria TaxID=2496075 RepID=A0A8J5IS92_9STRA|nr:hypothetical protein JG688_00011916 [Phytophthora aleatoria]
MDSDDTSSAPSWENIPFNDLTVCETIGGGGVALVHRGIYRKNSVALKTLFDPRVDEALKQEFMDELLVMRSIECWKLLFTR